MRKNAVLEGIIEPVVTGMSYEYVGLEYLAQGKHSILRIYIDKPEGVTLDDCSAVSHQVSAVLDVEDPIHGEYNLEISSPGLDRPLFTLAHFERFIGQKCAVRMRAPIEGQRKFTGLIKGIENDAVVLDLSDKLVTLPIDGMDKANLVPEF
ncbi:MAG: ribosome maturation factor RimP [Gammaproteobacteria bacterium]|nr:ribosome maturation factor RimP [Gammaproteobacteria bacterium]